MSKRTIVVEGKEYTYVIGKSGVKVKDLAYFGYYKNLGFSPIEERQAITPKDVANLIKNYLQKAGLV